MRMKAYGDASNTPSDERALFGSDHPNRDIGIPSQQVLHSVGQGKLDNNTRMPGTEISENRGQHFRPHDFAGGNSHDCASLETLFRDCSDEGSSCTGHRLRIRLERMGGIGGPEPALASSKQRGAKR